MYECDVVIMDVDAMCWKARELCVYVRGMRGVRMEVNVDIKKRYHEWSLDSPDSETWHKTKK